MIDIPSAPDHAYICTANVQTYAVKATTKVLKTPTKEQVRKKGQVWTPEWVADAMSLYVLQSKPATIHEPSVGAGAFVRAIARVGKRIGHLPAIAGTELHPEHLDGLLDEPELADLNIKVQCGDFLDPENSEPISGIVANPPYIRHQLFDEGQKRALQRIAETTTGKQIDRRTGYHVFFLLRAFQRMTDNARLAFILPADTFEGLASSTVVGALARHGCIDGIATFAPGASPFPGVDTNPVIILLRKGGSTDQIAWAHIKRAGTDALECWVRDNMPTRDDSEILALHRTVEEGLETGLSRAPRKAVEEETVALSDIADVVRGIATGANEYFLMTRAQIESNGVPKSVLRRCVRRTRDVAGEALTDTDLDKLEADGAPIWLLYLGGPAADPAIGPYLAEGVRQGVPERPLVSTRNPWYRMEQRETPQILFAYLGRGNIRFIRNYTDALALNGFLCLHPHDPKQADAIANMLNDPLVKREIRYAAKSYGDGAVKIEPNALRDLRLPVGLLKRYGVNPVVPIALTLFKIA